MNRHDLNHLLNEITDSLRYLKKMGIQGGDCSESGLGILDEWERPPTRTITSPTRQTLENVRRDLGDCRKCRLCESRRNIVFGAGNLAARLVFVGEGPGADEDREGEPFVGAAGELLNRILHAMKLRRDEVYICNIVKCRPPANRNPDKEEIESCFPFLEQQLRVIRPEVICALGSVAAQTLLSTPNPISRLRGHFHNYNGIPVMPTYHPAYLLRNPEKKRAVWEDMQKVMKRIGIALN